MHTQVQKYKRGEPYMDMDCTSAQCLVQGDVKLTVHHDKLPAPCRVAHLWFHADFVALNFLVFSKEHIDKANKVGQCCVPFAAVGLVVEPSVCAHTHRCTVGSC